MLVALSGLAGSRVLGSDDPTTTVWTTRAAMAAGQPVGAADLEPTVVRFGSPADAAPYLSARAALPAAARLDRALGAGELLPRAALTGRRDVALVQVPLSVAAEAVPQTVAVGSVVDVWVTPGESGAGDPRVAAKEATMVFDDVSILAVPEAASSFDPTAARQVLVGVDPDRVSLPSALTALAGGPVLLTVQP